MVKARLARCAANQIDIVRRAGPGRRVLPVDGARVSELDPEYRVFDDVAVEVPAPLEISLAQEVAKTGGEGDRGDCERGDDDGSAAPAKSARQPFERALRPGLDRIAAHEPPEVLRQRLGRSVAVRRFLAQALEHDGLEVARHARVDLFRLDGIALDDLAQRVGVVLATKRRPPGDHFVERRPERVDVRPVIDRNLLPPRLLRAHVERRADDIARDRQALLPFKASEAEVEDAQAALLVEDQVRGLDVAVYDLMRMRVLEAVGDFGEGLGEPFKVGTAVLFPEGGIGLRFGLLQLRKHLRQRFPLDVLHREVGRVLLNAHAVDRDHVPVVELGSRLGLSHEAQEGLVVSGDTRGEDLQGHLPIKRVLPRLVNHPHPPHRR